MLGKDENLKNERKVHHLHSAVRMLFLAVERKREGGEDVRTRPLGLPRSCCRICIKKLWIVCGWRTGAGASFRMMVSKCVLCARHLG